MNLEHKPSILIVGGGRVGASFAHYLYQQAFPLVALVETSKKRFKYIKARYKWPFLAAKLTADLVHKADIIIIAIKDNDIAQMADTLAGWDKAWKDTIVLHCSGALSSSILQPLAKKETLTASLHPIYAFGINPEENVSLDQLWFTTEGVAGISQILATHLGLKKSHLIEVNQQEKLAVHLACVFYANFFSALVDMGQEILQHVHALPKNNFALFSPLILSMIKQINENGNETALTGPVSRGDTDTILHHLRYLHENHPHLHEAYQLLGKRLIEISGLSSQKKSRMIELLNSWPTVTLEK